jgi:hypothetical protein
VSDINAMRGWVQLVRNKQQKPFWLGKQHHRLPNIGVNIIADVGLDEASPTYRANSI